MTSFLTMSFSSSSRADSWRKRQHQFHTRSTRIQQVIMTRTSEESYVVWPGAAETILGKNDPARYPIGAGGARDESPNPTAER